MFCLKLCTWKSLRFRSGACPVPSVPLPHAGCHLKVSHSMVDWRHRDRENYRSQVVAWRGGGSCHKKYLES